MIWSRQHLLFSVRYVHDTVSKFVKIQRFTPWVFYCSFWGIMTDIPIVSYIHNMYLRLYLSKSFLMRGGNETYFVRTQIETGTFYVQTDQGGDGGCKSNKTDKPAPISKTRTV